MRKTLILLIAMLAGTVAATADTKTVFSESFDQCAGSGGNDGAWNGQIATGNIVADNDGWTFVSGSRAYQCAKFGAGSSKGSAETPALTSLSTSSDVQSTTLTFRAGAWNGDSEKTTLNLSIISAGELSQTSVTLTKGAFQNYSVTITGATKSSKIKFEAAKASNNRFFLDEVKVVQVVGSATGAPDAPSFTPESGSSVVGSMTVTMASSTSDVTFYYTVNGDTPTTSSASGSTVTLSGAGAYTVKAIAVRNGISSGMSTATFHVLPAAPTFNPSNGTSAVGNLAVLISTSEAGGEVYYTTDGTAPSASSNHGQTVTLTEPGEYTVKAIVIANGESSEVAMAGYTVRPYAPTLSPATGTIGEGSLTVTFACQTAGVTYHYTTDGSTPTASSASGASVTLRSVGDYTVNVIAVKNDVASTMSTAAYTVRRSGTSSLDNGDFALVTDASVLAAGDRIIIASAAEEGGAYAIANTSKANNRDQVAVEIIKKGDDLAIEEPSSDVEVYELVGQAGSWSLMATGSANAGKYLQCGGSSNGLKYTTTNTAATNKAAITINSEDNSADIVFNGGTGSCWIQYNSASSLFNCYSTGTTTQKPVYIYREVSDIIVIETVEGIANFKQTEPGTTVKLYLPVDADARVLYAENDGQGAFNAYVRDNSGAMCMQGIEPSRPLAYNQHLAGWIVGQYAEGENGLPLFTVAGDLTNTDELVIADRVTESNVMPVAIASTEVGDHLADWVTVSDLRVEESSMTLDNAFDVDDFEQPYTGALVDVSGIIAGNGLVYPLAPLGDPALTYVVNADKDFVLPPYDLNNVTVRWQHPLIADVWNPVVVPFDINDFDGQVAMFTGLEEGEPVRSSVTGEMIDAGDMQFSTVEAIDAGVPYLVKPYGDVTSLVVAGTTLRNTDVEPVRFNINGPVNLGSGAPRRALSAGNLYSMEGTYSPATVHDDYNTIKVLGSDGTWSNGLTMEVPGSSAYFRTPSNQAMNIVVDGQDVQTGIRDITVAAVAPQGIYNLMGVKMQCDWNELPAGIYIVNGRKAIKR